MTQTKTGASHIGGRLIRSAAATAFALGAFAAGVMLSEREAKALTCQFTGGVFTVCDYGPPFLGPPASPAPDQPLPLPPTDYLGVWLDTNYQESGVIYGYPSDKEIKFKTAPTKGSGNVEWSWIDLNGNMKPDPLADLWQVDLDFNPAVTDADFGGVAGVFEYGIRINPLTEHLTIHEFTLDAAILGTGSGYEVTKAFFKDHALTIPLLCASGSNTLVVNDGSPGKKTCDFSSLPVADRPTEVYVRETYIVTGSGIALDNAVNGITQTPGPLPILGAGAAFGFSRKLRSRIKASRTA